MITKERAIELLKLSDWETGNCAVIGAKKPDVPDMTEEERDEIVEKWRTMPRYTCFYDALMRIIRTNEHQTRHHSPF